MMEVIFFILFVLAVAFVALGLAIWLLSVVVLVISAAWHAGKGE